MAFTFEDDYQVMTSTDPERALDMLGADGPFAVVITDQRMPGLTGHTIRGVATLAGAAG